MGEIEQYYSDDYAGLESGNLSFYYGYEVCDPLTEDWCFQVKRDGKEVCRKTRTEIEETTDDLLNTPQDYLIVGIGIWISNNL